VAPFLPAAAFYFFIQQVLAGLSSKAEVFSAPGEEIWKPGIIILIFNWTYPNMQVDLFVGKSYL
jgi:hypothetical protein